VTLDLFFVSKVCGTSTCLFCVPAFAVEMRVFKGF
jgi:hypothetical protein